MQISRDFGRLECSFLRDWQFDDLGTQVSDSIYSPTTLNESESSFPKITSGEGEHFLLDFERMVKFEVSFLSRRVTAFERMPGVTRATVTHLLLDHVIPRVLAQRERLVLHASAVDFGGAMAIFLGDTGAGKSTLSASLLAANFRLIGDDAVVISRSGERFCGDAVYSSLRLYPEAIRAVMGGGVPTRAMAHYSRKQRVDLSGLSVSTGVQLPLAAIFFLAPEPAKFPQARKLRPIEICMRLIEQSFTLDSHDAQSAVRRLEYASAIASELNGFELSYPREFRSLPDLHETIISCLEASGHAFDSGGAGVF